MYGLVIVAVWMAALGARSEERVRSPQIDSSRRGCFRTRSVLVYASKRTSQRTGVVSGTRVTFRRAPRGWTGVAVDRSAQPQRSTVLQDLLLDGAGGRVYYLVPRQSREPLIVQGRIDCDSLWGTSRPRYSKQEPAPIALRRVRTAR